ncbi:ABC transporter permease [Mycolicibacterium moriokaense]|uniref:ABC transporter permease n=1 Tax=Mycolicibacterium moriokaense TaxID=39691 RepID=A0AAD1M8V8_9MYCO|nr:FtsX-like permease family protein [Mycolicibacterium moriokaense]MCV7039390.1 FtsX-like permease family protein [Mycolicibacterium moriokaense]ORB26785.1 ABC transporter permease [Mycolicibacterium moriokaense]BBX03915.1 ABC transporter permease [Mycolicibacterium moriokaense]
MIIDRLRVFNIREWRRHPGRTVLSFTVVAISAMLLVAVFGIAGSITGSADRFVAGIGGNANLEVSGVTDTGLPEAVRVDVAKVPGVAAAVPMLRTSIGPAAERVVLLGVDESINAMQSDLQRAVQDQIGSLATGPGAVAVGVATGHAVGDSIAVGNGKATVAAVITGADAEKINGGNFILGPLPLLQQLTNRVGMIDSVLVIAAPNADLASVRADVTEAVGGRAVVTDPTFRSAKSSGAVSIMSTLMLSAASCSLIVAGFLIFNAMSMSISQRRPVISLLRAVGGKKWQIVRDLLAEAGLVGLVSGIAGSALGVLIGRQAIAGLPAGLLQGLETRTDYILPGYAIPVTVAACIAVSVAATALAARQVYKVTPAEALVPVGTSTADTVPPSVRAVVGILGVFFIGAAAYIASIDLGKLSVAAIGLAVVGDIALCFAFAATIVRAASAVARAFGSPGALAAATIERAPRRVWATLMTVMIAVSITVQSTGANTNAIDSTNASFASLTDAALFVSPSPPGVLPTAPMLPSDAQSSVASIPGVAAAVPTQMAFATLGDNRVVVQGLAPGSVGPPVSDMNPQVLQQMLAGEGVVVSREIARNLGIGPGDVVTLPTPTGERKVRVLEVVPYFSLFGGLVSMGLTQMQEWFDRPGSTILDVKLTPGADRAEVEALIKDRLPSDVLVFSGDESVAAIEKGMASTTSLIDVMAWIVVFVASIALLNTLMLSVLERRRELGVMRAMGASRRFVLRTVVAEAAGIGVVGAVIGALFGAVNQYLATSALTNVLSIDVDYAVPVLAVVFACAAFMLTLLGAIPPAVRAARLEIVEAVAVE